MGRARVKHILQDCHQVFKIKFLMESYRRLTVESKTFVFSKEGRISICSTENSRRMVKFISLSGSSGSWVAQVVEGMFRTFLCKGFLRKLRLGNGSSHHSTPS